MRVLQDLSLAALTIAFLLRFRVLFRPAGSFRALFSRRGFYPWLACGIGALAILTQGTVWPQAVLDKPLGGTNALKLLQDILTVVAFTLLIWNAIDVSTPRPQSRRRFFGRMAFAVAMLLGLVISFSLISDRGPTDYLFVEHNQGRWDVWLFGSVYILEMLMVSAVLLAAIRGRRARPFWWFRVGCALVILACLAEFFDLCSSHIPLLHPLGGVGRSIFDPLFYPGTLAIIMTLVYFTTLPWRRARKLMAHFRSLESICEVHQLPYTRLLTTVKASDLADIATVIRDAHIARTARLSQADINALNRAEEYLEHEYGDSQGLGDKQVIVINGGSNV